MTAASELAVLRESVGAASAAAAASTTTLLAAGADEVSTAIAEIFAAHGQAYRALSAQAADFHAQFVRALQGAGSSYATAEAANASPMQQALNAVNAPAQALLGRPLVGNGTNGAPGQAGGDGGLLWGNGGNGGAGGGSGHDGDPGLPG